MSLLPDEDFREEGADKPWTQEEMDALCDWLFEGTAPIVIARSLRRTEKSIRRRIEWLESNELNIAERYQPKQRTDRSGLRLTQNERDFIRKHKERGLPIEVTAKILMRDPKDFALAWSRTATQACNAPSIMCAMTALDVVLACCYARQCFKADLVTDVEYDALCQEAKARNATLFGELLMRKVEHYPDRIRDLAWYLHKKVEMRKPK
jgi:hypothetical protein